MIIAQIAMRFFSFSIKEFAKYIDFNDFGKKSNICYFLVFYNYTRQYTYTVYT